MKWICALGAAVLAVSCGGAKESHNSSQSGATAHAGLANPGSQPVTLRGCLQNADHPDATAVPTGSAGQGSAGNAVDQRAAGQGSPGERFTLTQATSTSKASDPAAGSYILDGNLDALREHLHHQVRVVGMLDPAASNTAGPQRIRVQSIANEGSSNCAGQ